MFKQSGRQVGVRTPENQSTEAAPAQTLVNFQEMKTYAISFGDARGRSQVAVVAKIGDIWYMPPNGESWAAELRPVSAWLVKQLEEKHAASNPSNDMPRTEVDVLGGEPTK